MWCNIFLTKMKLGSSQRHLLLSVLGVLPATTAFTPRWGQRAHSVVVNQNYLQSFLEDHHYSSPCRLWMSASATPVQNNSTTSSWDELEVNDEDAAEDDSSPLLDEFQSWSTALDQAIESLRKKRRSLESELLKAQGVEDTVARGQLLVSNLYLFTPRVKSATVQDWENDGLEVELVLDSQYDSASAEADALFAKARKLKRGSKVVSDLLEQTADAWNLLQEAQVDLQSALDGNEVGHGRLALVQDRLTRSARATNFQIPSEADDSRSSATSSSSSNTNRRQSKPEIGTPASNLRKLQSPGGCTVLVGRNRRGNENLSLAIARGTDIWMHSRGCPGAHVLIQNRRGGPTPTDECLQFAADLAIFYSDLRNESKAPVTAAEPKHLTKPRGAPLGAINVREEWKTFVGRPDQVPEELKVARDESGQSNEYRSRDKAKHRRRTKQVAEEERAKRKKALKDKKNQ
jgi:predicted ribosome quality control (RQC) complex YloA/Tae2 family protein